MTAYVLDGSKSERGYKRPPVACRALTPCRHCGPQLVRGGRRHGRLCQCHLHATPNIFDNVQVHSFRYPTQLLDAALLQAGLHQARGMNGGQVLLKREVSVREEATCVGSYDRVHDLAAAYCC